MAPGGDSPEAAVPTLRMEGSLGTGGGPCCKWGVLAGGGVHPPYTEGASSLCRRFSFYENKRLRNLMDTGTFSIIFRDRKIHILI